MHSLQPVHPPVERTCAFLRSLIKRDKDERYDSDLERSLHPRTHLLSSRFLRAAPSKAAKWLRPGHGPRTCVHIAPATIHLFYLLPSRFFHPACIFYMYHVHARSNIEQPEKWRNFWYRAQISIRQLGTWYLIADSTAGVEILIIDIVSASDQLAVSDEYTRHEQTAIFRATASLVGNKIKKWNDRLVATLFCIFNSLAYSVFDEYTFCRRLFFPTCFSYTLLQLSNRSRQLTG